MNNDFLLIGEIVRPQGIRGEVKVRALSEDKTRYSRLKKVFAGDPAQRQEYAVLKGRCSGEFAYLTLSGVETRDEAEKLRGTLLYVSREEAIQLEEGRYFVCDLIGLRAKLQDGTEVGELRDVLSPNPYCDVYVFSTPRGEMQMPALKRVILSVDLENREIVLDGAVLEEIALWPDTPGIQENE